MRIQKAVGLKGDLYEEKFKECSYFAFNGDHDFG